jgi:tetratricopeptide (TPR) repeat protein
LKQALAEDPKQADWHAALGGVELAKKQPDLALQSAHEALKIVGNHGPAKWVEAKALAEKGDIDLAIEAFQAAYGLMRTDPAPLVDAARACMKAGRLTTGKAFADRATDDFPKSALAWEATGDIDVALKDKGAAKDAYQKALAGDASADKAAIQKKLAALR